VELKKIKTFPLRMDQHTHEKIGQALERSILKSKHDFIMKAIAEKIEREANRAV
jgi:hypothetical protein